MKVEIKDKTMKEELQLLIKGMTKLRVILDQQKKAADNLDLVFLAIPLEASAKAAAAYVRAWKDAIQRLDKSNGK